MFLKNHNGRVAVQVAESPDSVAIVWRESSTWDVCALSPTDLERAGWRPWKPIRRATLESENEPVDLTDALRRVVEGPPGLTPLFGPGALEALAKKFPEGPFHLFTETVGLIHRFKDYVDAALVSLRLSPDAGRRVIFGSETQLKSLPRSDLEIVAAILEMKEPAAKPSPQYIKEMFEMAKSTKAKEGKKVSKVKAKAKRADGPVAKALALYDKCPTPQDTDAMLKLAATAGVNPATAKTQLYKWRKEHGVKAVRVKAEKKVAPAVKKAAKDKKAKAEKKESVKESAAKAEKAKSKKSVVASAGKGKAPAKKKSVKKTPAEPVAASTPEAASTESTPPPAEEKLQQQAESEGQA